MKGFTLIELLVVVAISAMISSIALVYSSISRNEVALTVETSKVAQVLLQAKQLAISTYNNSQETCGFGVMFNTAAGTYSIFSYTPANHPPEHGIAPPCPNSTIASTSPIFADEMKEYSAGTWNVPLDQGVKFNAAGGADFLKVVMFYPPAPTTFISRDGSTFLNPSAGDITSNVYLETVDNNAKESVSVNGGGQVNF